MSQQQPLCVITGVGPGTGSALTRRFANGGYRMAMLARNNDRLTALEREIPEAKGFVCDVSDPAQVTHTVDAVESTLGEPSVLIHNAIGGAWGTLRIKTAAPVFSMSRSAPMARLGSARP